MMERDFIGYGRNKPQFRWPNGAGLALVVVQNLEEGAESSIPDGDAATDLALTDAIMGEVPAGTRDFVAESLFEYGSRAGFWRLHQMFLDLDIPPTLSACAAALRRNPELAQAIATAKIDICAHGNRFARHFLMDPATESVEIAAAIAGITQAVGYAPTGWQSRYSPSAQTRKLLAAHDCIRYDADSYADDLPYWVDNHGRPHLVVPHSFTLNDNRLPSGKLGTGDDFLTLLQASLRVLLREAEHSPRLMTISLHNRVSGHPARFDAIWRFLSEHAGRRDIWFASRADVAAHFRRMVQP